MPPAGNVEFENPRCCEFGGDRSLSAIDTSVVFGEMAKTDSIYPQPATDSVRLSRKLTARKRSDFPPLPARSPFTTSLRSVVLAGDPV